jgi:hypothetical protein
MVDDDHRTVERGVLTESDRVEQPEGHWIEGAIVSECHT